MIEMIEAAVDEDGVVVLARPASVSKTRRALVIVLDEKPRLDAGDFGVEEYLNVLTRQYRKKRDRLKWSFPLAYEFLSFLENQQRNLWLDTGKNAHVYWRNTFLMYIKLPGSEATHKILLSPQPRAYTPEGIENGSREFFPMTEILAKFDAQAGDWARVLDDGGVEINDAAPAEFFEALKASVGEIVDAWEHA